MPTSGDEWSNSYTLTWIKGSWASEVFSFGMYCFSRSLLQLMKELSSGKRSLNNGNACSKDKNSARSGALFLLLTPVISSVILSSSHSVSGWDSSRNTNSLDLAGKRKEWIILAIRLCDRNLSEDLQRNLETMAGGEAQTIPCQVHHRGHQPTEVPFSQAQRSTAKWQVGTQIKGWGRDTQWGPSQGCPRRDSAQGSRPKTHQNKSMPEHFLD